MPAELYARPARRSRYARAKSVALAFLVALQLLTPKQRAALILREVVGMEASECAELLGLSVAAVNSALQRAREVLAKRHAPLPPPDPGDDAVLARYVAAWERADSAALVALLRDDATLAMPPLREWLRGSRRYRRVDPGAWCSRARAPGVFARADRGQRPAGLRGLRRTAHALAIHLVDTIDGRIAAITAFLSPRCSPCLACR